METYTVTDSGKYRPWEFQQYHHLVGPNGLVLKMLQILWK